MSFAFCKRHVAQVIDAHEKACIELESGGFGMKGGGVIDAKAVPATARYTHWSTMVAILCAAATAYGIYRLIVLGPFGWHVEQPDFKKGVIEFLAVFFVNSAVLMLLRGRLAWLAVGAVVLLYMRLHGTDLALAVGAAYCIGIYGLGRMIVGAGPENIYSYRCSALAVATGVGSMAVVLMLGALLFEWDFAQNRLAAFATAGVGLLFVAIRWLMADQRMKGALPRSSISNLSISLLIAVAAVCIARSNLAFYFDSAWYGLRPDRVLIGPHGFYEFLGLTTQVYYYPKLYELLLAPVLELGDISTTVVVGVFCAGFLAYAMVSLGRTLGLPTAYGLVLAALMLCFPAVVGTVETPKGDVLAAAFVIFSAIALIKAYETRSPSVLLDVVIYCLLASTIRLSALPWLGLIFAAWLVAGLMVIFSAKRRKFELVMLVPVALVLAAFLLTHARTYLLTGVPLVTNASTQAQLAELGFNLKYPIGTFTGTGDSRAGLLGGISALGKIALTPDIYALHVFKWMGAAWLVFLVAAFIRPDRAFPGFRGVVSLICILVTPLLLGFNAWADGGPAGDGNYFMVSIAFIYVCGAVAVRRFSRLSLLILLTCAFSGGVVYLFSANWNIGTGVRPLSVVNPVFDEEKQVESFLEGGKLGVVGERLSHCGRHTRMIGELRTPESFMLPVRFEPFEELSWSNSRAFRSEEAFSDFLYATGTDLVALPARENDAGKRREMVDFARDKLESTGPIAARSMITLGGVSLYAMTPAGVQCIYTAAFD